MDASGDVTKTTQPVIMQPTPAPDGHRDTGDSPTPVNSPPDADSADEPTPQALAWQSYDTHRSNCSKCQTSVWRCAAGDELWRDYLGAAL
jgi:hypothetical protein